MSDDSYRGIERDVPEPHLLAHPVEQVQVGMVYGFQEDLRQLGSLEHPYIKPDPYLLALSQPPPVPTEPQVESNGPKQRRPNAKRKRADENRSRGDSKENTQGFLRRSTRERTPVDRYSPPKKAKRGPLEDITHGSKTNVAKTEPSTFHDRRGVMIIQADESLGALFLGNEEVAKNDNFIEECEIGGIVNVAKARRKLTKSLSDVHYSHHPMEDSDEQSLSSTEAVAATDELHTILSSRKNALVHCKLGRSRSVAVVCLYLMQKQQKTLKECIRFLESANVRVQMNDGFMAQLLEQERKIHGINSILLDVGTVVGPIEKTFWNAFWRNAQRIQNSPHFSPPRKVSRKTSSSGGYKSKSGSKKSVLPKRKNKKTKNVQADASVSNLSKMKQISIDSMFFKETPSTQQLEQPMNNGDGGQAPLRSQSQPNPQSHLSPTRDAEVPIAARSGEGEGVFLISPGVLIPATQ